MEWVLILKIVQTEVGVGGGRLVWREYVGEEWYRHSPWHSENVNRTSRIECE